MPKEKFLSIGDDLEGFEIVDPQNAPQGLTKEILWDLWDIGVKFGSFFDKGIGFKASPLVMELYDFRNNRFGGTAGFTVGKSRPSCLMEEGVSLFKLKNDMNVLWDKGLTIDDVFAIIKKIDDHAVSEGMKIDGQRIALINENMSQTNKMAVQIFIDNPGTVMLVFPGMDAKQILNDFDHPDFLNVIDLGPLKLICLKGAEEKITEDFEIKIKRLQKMGITEKDLENMTAEKILELKKLLQ